MEVLGTTTIISMAQAAVQAQGEEIEEVEGAASEAQDEG